MNDDSDEYFSAEENIEHDITDNILLEENDIPYNFFSYTASDGTQWILPKYFTPSNDIYLESIFP
tara:strand:+ start:91 stop:285 length:195 start_codon:yes stop_codon:yes gene_type:complete